MFAVARGLLAAQNLADAVSVFTDPNALAAIYVAAKLSVHLFGAPAKAYVLARYGNEQPRWARTFGACVRRLLPKAQLRLSSWLGLVDAVANGVMLAPLAMWLWHASQLGPTACAAVLGMHELLGLIVAYEVFESLWHASSHAAKARGHSDQ
ncbi:hypothetical protein APY03_0929 [Variovorax sp. WDL1]|nr:hypothetical protein APY03_0929 [Variovorax sp. WDL1]